MKSLISTMGEFEAKLAEMIENDDVEFAVQVAVRKSDGFVLHMGVPFTEKVTPRYIARVLHHVADRYENGEVKRAVKS